MKTIIKKIFFLLFLSTQVVFLGSLILFQSQISVVNARTIDSIENYYNSDNFYDSNTGAETKGTIQEYAKLYFKKNFRVEYTVRIAIEGDSYVRYNEAHHYISGDDPIVYIIPKWMFSQINDKIYMGKEYGFYINTRLEEKTYLTEIFLFDISVTDNYALLDPHKETKLDIVITPLFSYKFSIPSVPSELNNFVVPCYYTSYYDSWDGIPTPVAKFEQSSKYSLKNIVVGTKLENRNHDNEQDHGYNVYQDEGKYVSKVAITYKGADINNHTISTFLRATDHVAAYIGSIPFLGDVIGVVKLVQQSAEVAQLVKSGMNLRNAPTSNVKTKEEFVNAYETNSLPILRDKLGYIPKSTVTSFVTGDYYSFWKPSKNEAIVIKNEPDQFIKFSHTINQGERWDATLHYTIGLSIASFSKQTVVYNSENTSSFEYDNGIGSDEYNQSGMTVSGREYKPLGSIGRDIQVPTFMTFAEEENARHLKFKMYDYNKNDKLSYTTIDNLIYSNFYSSLKYVFLVSSQEFQNLTFFTYSNGYIRKNQVNFIRQKHYTISIVVNSLDQKTVEIGTGIHNQPYKTFSVTASERLVMTFHNDKYEDILEYQGEGIKVFGDYTSGDNGWSSLDVERYLRIHNMVSNKLVEFGRSSIPSKISSLYSLDYGQQNQYSEYRFSFNLSRHKNISLELFDPNDRVIETRKIENSYSNIIINLSFSARDLTGTSQIQILNSSNKTLLDFHGVGDVKFRLYFYGLQAPKEEFTISGLENYFTLLPTHYDFPRNYFLTYVEQNVLLPNNQSIYTRRLRTGFQENLIVMSPRHENAGVACIEYHFGIKIYAMAFDISYWSSQEWEMLSLSLEVLENGKWVVVQDFLHQNVSTDRNNQTRFEILLDGVSEFRFYATAKAAGVNNKGRVTIGEIEMYV